MDKNMDFEKLIEQARFITQLMSSGVVGAEEVKHEADVTPVTLRNEESYAGAYSHEGSSESASDKLDDQDILERTLKAINIFQSLNKNDKTSDNVSAYDSTSAAENVTSDPVVGNDFVEYVESAPDEDIADIAEEEDTGDRTEEQKDPETDFSRMYDETFSTPQIKAIKSAIQFVDPKHHKVLGLWVKFLEMQNMAHMYEERAEPGYGQQVADWRRGMLLSVRPHVSTEKKYFLDLLIKIIELKEIISVMEG